MLSLFVVVNLLCIFSGANIVRRSQQACSGDSLNTVLRCMYSNARDQGKKMMVCSEKCFTDNNCPLISSYPDKSDDKKSDDKSEDNGKDSSSSENNSRDKDKSDSKSKDDDDNNHPDVFVAESGLLDFFDNFDDPVCLHFLSLFAQHKNKTKLEECFADLQNYTTHQIYSCMKENDVEIVDFSPTNDSDDDEAGNDKTAPTTGYPIDEFLCNMTAAQDCLTTKCVSYQMVDMCKEEESCSTLYANLCDFKKSQEIYRNCRRTVIKDGFADLKKHFFTALKENEYPNYPITKEAESCFVNRMIASFTDPCEEATRATTLKPKYFL